MRGVLEDRGVLKVERVFERLRFGYKTVTDIRIPAAAEADAAQFPVVDRNISSKQRLFFYTATVQPPSPAGCSAAAQSSCAAAERLFSVFD